MERMDRLYRSERQRKHKSTPADRGGTSKHSHRCCEASRASTLLLARDHRCFVSSGFPAGGTGRADVQAAGLDENSRCWLLFRPGDHAGSGADGHVHQG